MSSKETVNKREYYRNTFNPTLHPIIYHCLRELQVQAENFQIVVDPIYDRFLRDVNCTIGSQEVNNEERDKVNEDSINIILNKRGKRFASLSIITAGNAKVSGFSNITHEDNDFLASRLLSQCDKVINT